MTIKLSTSIVLILLIFSCNSSGKADNQITDPDSEHYPKDNPETLRVDGVLQTGWYLIKDTPTAYKRQLEKTNETFNIDPTPIVTQASFDRITIFHEKDCYALFIWLDKTGSRAMNIAKQGFKSKKLAFIIDNRLLRTQSVDDPQFTMVGDNVDARVYGQTLALPCNSFSPDEMEHYKTIIEHEK